jgi:hypothetical protein
MTKVLLAAAVVTAILICMYNYQMVLGQSDYTTTYLSKDDIGLPNDPTNSKEIPVTYERLKYIEKNMMCSTTLSNFRMESNATLEAECRYIFENGVKVEQEHEAEQARLDQLESERLSKLYRERQAIERANEQKYYTDMGYVDKVNSVLNQCKIQSVNASIAELRECIEFIPWYYENVVK